MGQRFSRCPRPLTALAPLQSKPPRYTINPDRLRESLEALSRFGRNPEGGVSRLAWTRPDIDALKGISHSPHELTRWEDAANGCEVLLRTVLAIDRR